MIWGSNSHMLHHRHDVDRLASMFGFDYNFSQKTGLEHKV